MQAPSDPDAPAPMIEAAALPATVDDLLLITDPDIFVEQAYRSVLGRPADPSGGAYYRSRLSAGFGQPFVLAALRASKEAHERQIPSLPGFGLAPLVYILWRYGRGAGLAEPGRWCNLVYHHWRQWRLALTGRQATRVDAR